MKKRKLTPNQEKLLKIVTPLFQEEKEISYDTLKRMSDFKSFESTFNAMLFKGYFEHVNSGNFLNEYKLA